MIIYEIGKIIEIFLGPFFTAYIFKISTNSITIVSLYNIFSYFIIAFLAVVLGIFIKNRNEMLVFRLGMISQFFQLLIVVFLGKRIVKYIWIAALISGLIPLLSTIILLFFTNKITIVGYNIIYAFFIQIITVIKEVNTLKITDSSTINDSNRTEVYVLIELFLGIGRIISYVLLLIVGVLNSILFLKILIIFLSLCILFSGIHLTKIDVD